MRLNAFLMSYCCFLTMIRCFSEVDGRRIILIISIKCVNDAGCCVQIILIRGGRVRHSFPIPDRNCMTITLSVAVHDRAILNPGLEAISL
jgi:hypothetical protein